MFRTICYFCLLIVLAVFPGSVESSEYRIVTFGDSTTALRGPLRIYSKILNEKLVINGQKVTVINSGIPGNTTKHAKGRFKKDVLDHKPDLVIIQYGINDAAVDVHKTPPATKSRVSKKEYHENLTHFVKTLKSRNIKVIMMTPNPCTWTKKLKNSYGKPPYDPKDPDGFNLFLSEYAELARKIASKEQIPLVDIYREFKEFGKTEGQSEDDLLLDGMHPNNKGHEIVAEKLMKVITKDEN